MAKELDFYNESLTSPFKTSTTASDRHHRRKKIGKKKYSYLVIESLTLSLGFHAQIL
jgi:hypothetical protein